MPLVLELERAYAAARRSGLPGRTGSFLTHYAGRPSPLYFASG